MSRTAILSVHSLAGVEGSKKYPGRRLVKGCLDNNNNGIVRKCASAAPMHQALDASRLAGARRRQQQGTRTDDAAACTDHCVTPPASVPASTAATGGPSSTAHIAASTTAIVRLLPLFSLDLAGQLSPGKEPQ